LGNPEDSRLTQPYPRGRFPQLNVRRKRLADGTPVAYFYHKAARVRLYSPPGTKAFAAEYDLAERGQAPARGLRPAATWVYFIRAEVSGNIKIGKASSPRHRLAQLQVSTVETLRLEATIYDPSGGALERDLHRRFDRLRIRGEWFASDKDLEAYITECAAIGTEEFRGRA